MLVRDAGFMNAGLRGAESERVQGSGVQRVRGCRAQGCRGCRECRDAEGAGYRGAGVQSS